MRIPCEVQVVQVKLQHAVGNHASCLWCTSPRLHTHLNLRIYYSEMQLKQTPAGYYMREGATLDNVPTHFPNICPEALYVNRPFSVFKHLLKSMFGFILYMYMFQYKYIHIIQSVLGLRLSHCFLTRVML